MAQIVLGPLQLDDVPPHAVGEGQGALLHPPNLLQGDVQLPQQLDLPQGLHVRLAVVPVAVVRPTGGEKPLLFIEADVSLCDADQLLDLVDLHCVSPLTALPYTLYRVEGQEKSF